MITRAGLRGALHNHTNASDGTHRLAQMRAAADRLDLPATHLAMARERGIQVSIAADAHSTAGLDHLDHGIAIARRAGLTPEDVLSCLSVEALLAHFVDRRARTGRS